RRLISLLFATAVLLAVPWLPAHAQNGYFFPQAGEFDPAIPTPEQFLGYPLGSRYTRHDQLVAYFEELARHSDAIAVQRIGNSYEGRPLLLATITAASNQARLESLRQQLATLADPAQPASVAAGS